MKRKMLSIIMATVILLGMISFPASAATVTSRPATDFTYHGLLGEAFLTQSSSPWGFTTAKGSYVDTDINFGSMEDILMVRTGVSDNAGMRWTGWIVPPETGVYNFRCYSDNGSRLWIGDDGASTDDALINYWNSGWWWDQTSTPTSWSGNITLNAGTAYYFRLDYFEAVGGSNVRLVWKNDQGLDEQVVPASAYYLPDTYSGPKISTVDISNAQLDLDKGDTGGVITINGANLNGVTARMTTSGGKEVCPLDILSNDGIAIVVSVPSGLKAGMYKILVTGGGYDIAAPELFFVSTSGLFSDRPEHPRPDWKREQWMNLNGWWDFNYDPQSVGLTEQWQDSHSFTQKINVPFGWTTELSGVTNNGYRGEAWYQKSFVIDETWIANGKQVYVYFGAVDNWCRVYINGHEVQLDTPQYYFGEYINGHRGGYTPIDFNLTPYLNPPGEENKLTVWVEDKAVYAQHGYVALVGKQGREAPCGYVQTGGIWQTVMLESRGQASLGYVHANPHVFDEQKKVAQNGKVTFDLEINNKASAVPQNVTVDFAFTPKKYNVKTEIDEVTGESFSGSVTLNDIPAGKITEYIGAVTIDIPNQKLWDDVNPNLYYGTATLKIGGQVVDTVSMYFGQREVDIRVQGQDGSGRNYSHVNINGRPIFQAGLLDQGFWVEGLYTAPSEAALRYDIESMRQRGFNMIRKHLKVEDPLQYTWADKLGMLIWQDIPHANAMMVNQYTSTDTYAPGRDIYLDCLDSALRRDYNRPSVVAIMLFNETWGLNRGSASATSNTNPAELKGTYTYNRTTTATVTQNPGPINVGNENDWIARLYFHTKEINPNLIVEDDSACNNDHINPTDLNTWHSYDKGYSNAYNTINSRENNAYPGSTNNFRTNSVNNSLGAHQQLGQPLLNSEYGSVGYGDWDYDISYCFKYWTDFMRQTVKHGGYVYTEPHDIENERNGLLTWERYQKVMGYEDVAWGGDMSIADLNQPDYVGLEGNPAPVMTPGSTYTRNAVAMNWSGNTYTGATLKWRFDATDSFGNNITTGLSGSIPVNFAPLTQEKKEISFTLPTLRAVGTLTVWIEDSAGNKLAKNFTNVIVRPSGSSLTVESVTEDSFILRQPTAASSSFTNGVGQAVYNFTVPDDFDPANLKHVRLMAEISSVKDAVGTDRYNPLTKSEGSQTSEGYEKPTDVTVSINGHEVDTLFVPDNPRDIRATQALGAFVSNSSSGNFGYLVNLNLSDALIETLKTELESNATLTVTYAVKNDAENKGGLRVYSETNGRWAVQPTILLNPADEYIVGNYETNNTNYAVETVMSEGQSFNMRGGVYTVAYESGQIVLKQGSATLGSVGVTGSGAAVRVRLFDTKITLWVNDNPEPSISVYDKTPATVGNISGNGLKFVITPETYETTGEGMPEAQADVNIVDSFNNGANPTQTNRYTTYSGGTSSTWTYATASGNGINRLQYTSSTGGKVLIADSVMTDGVVEVDVTLTAGTDTGNSGFLVRSSSYGAGADALNGYYIGIGRNNNSSSSNIGGTSISAGYSFLQIGRMSQNWTQLYIVALSNASVSYPISHRLSVSIVGSRIQVFVDGTLRATVYDTTYTSGSVGFRTYNAAGYIDNMVISTAPRYSNSFTATSPGSDATLANFTGSWTTEGGVWSISGNRLVSSGVGAALVGNYGWSDYEYTASVRPTSDDTVAGLMLRGYLYGDKDSGYLVTLNRPDGKIQLLKLNKGVTTLLAEKNFTFASGNTTNYPLIVRAVNNTIRVYANTDGSTGTPNTAKPLMTVVDNAFPTGMAGVVNLAGTAAFDNIDIKDKFVWQEEFYDGTLSGWNQYGSGTATVANNELTLVQNANGYKLTDGYATWNNYTIKADIKLLTKSGKSNGGFTYLSTDFGSGQDDLRGFVTGINYNGAENPLANEHTGAETGAIHYGWTALTNTAAGEITFDPSQWHPMEITLTSTSDATTNIKVWVDGYLCYDYNAPANRDFHYGQIAARVFNSDMMVRNLRVIPYGEQEPIVAFSIAGKVLPGASVVDASGLTVTLYGFADTGFTTPLGTAVTEADGSYAIDTEVPNGKYVVRIIGQDGKFDTSTAVIDLIANITDANISLSAVKTDLIVTNISEAPLSAAVVLDSAAGDDANARIMIAFYDIDGKLISVKTVTEATAIDGTFKRLDVSVDSVPANAATAKAYVWSSEYAPLRAAKPINLG